MQQLWKVDTTKCEVRAVMGANFPERDSEGTTIYTNTHFRTPEEAWDRLLANAEAGVRLAARAVVSARTALRDAEQRAAQEAVNYADAKSAHDAFLAQDSGSARQCALGMPTQASLDG